MRRGLGTAAVLLAALLLGGCGGVDSDDGDTDSGESNGSADDAAGGGSDESIDEGAAERGTGGEGAAPAARIDPAPRQVIHNVDLTVAVDDIEGAAQRAATLAQTSGGFVAAESAQGDESATLTLRVASETHTDVVTRLEELGEVRERHRSADDVTEEVVDVEARIASQRRSIDRIRVLLDQAADIDDVVRIESELAQREAELDSLLQRQEELSGLTSLATITVTFVADGAEPEDDTGFLSGLSGGWDAFVGAATIAATVLGALLPFAIAALVVGIPSWLFWRRHRPAASATTSDQA
jgi:hypothetical protein